MSHGHGSHPSTDGPSSHGSWAGRHFLRPEPIGMACRGFPGTDNHRRRRPESPRHRFLISAATPPVLCMNGMGRESWDASPRSPARGNWIVLQTSPSPVHKWGSGTPSHRRSSRLPVLEAESCSPQGVTAAAAAAAARCCRVPLLDGVATYVCHAVCQVISTVVVGLRSVSPSTALGDTSIGQSRGVACSTPRPILHSSGKGPPLPLGWRGQDAGARHEYFPFLSAASLSLSPSLTMGVWRRACLHCAAMTECCAARSP